VSILIAAIRSLAAYVAVSLFVIIVGPPAIILAKLLDQPMLLFGPGYFGVRMGLVLSGIASRADGVEHINDHRPTVYAVNHASNLEPPIVFVLLRRLFPKLSILYKAELRKLPILVWAFDIVRFVPLERRNPGQSFPAVDRAADLLRSGYSFMIYPEGTRSRTGELLPFKRGGFIMAIKAQAPIVPVAVKGARDAMRKGSPIIRPITARVRFGAPVETRGRSIEDRDDIVNEVRASMEAMLAEL
jgi:1-acyl-sn-glycerol-3-phosphate acyltransferase